MRWPDSVLRGGKWMLGTRGAGEEEADAASGRGGEGEEFGNVLNRAAQRVKAIKFQVLKARQRRVSGLGATKVMVLIVEFVCGFVISDLWFLVYTLQSSLMHLSCSIDWQLPGKYASHRFGMLNETLNADTTNMCMQLIFIIPACRNARMTARGPQLLH